MSDKLFGQMADEKAAKGIIRDLASRGIVAQMHFNQVEKIFELTVDDPKHLVEAFELFRVRVGLAAPPQKMDEEWLKIKSVPLGKITSFFILISVGCYFLFAFKVAPEILNLFFISKSQSGALDEIMSGQIWRIFTPMFLHFSLMHIFFNMMWFKDMGSVQEKIFGPKFLIIFLLTTAAFSNLSQFYLGGARFGGMSGVVYAQLGFLWIYKKYDTSFEYSLPKRDVMMMIAWFFLCLFQLFPFGIANMAHAAGLSLGILFAVALGVFKQKGPPISLQLLGHISLAIGLSVFTWLFEYNQIISKH